MFTGQIIGYVGADARQNKNGKGFNFHVSTKYKNVNNEEQTLWVCCFVNYESKVFAMCMPMYSRRMTVATSHPPA